MLSPMYTWQYMANHGIHSAATIDDIWGQSTAVYVNDATIKGADAACTHAYDVMKRAIAAWRGSKQIKRSALII